MFEYRVTKYDPAHRDARGAYRRDEWTMFSQVGSSFGGVLFTCEEYQRVEEAYVATAIGFWDEVGRPALIVRGLERSQAASAPSENSAVNDAPVLADVVRRMLREEFWCRLESSACFLHFGWDYYMYVGVSNVCPRSRALAAASGLFVEEVVSPYHPEEDDA
jgi:hypothetical protein